MGSSKHKLVKKKAKSSKNRKSFGKHLDAELRDALSGPAARYQDKKDTDLFYVNTKKDTTTTPALRRNRVRKLYVDNLKAKAKELAKIKSKPEHPLLAKYKKAAIEGTLSSSKNTVTEVIDHGSFKEVRKVSSSSLEASQLYDPWNTSQTEDKSEPVDEWCAPQVQNKITAKRRRVSEKKFVAVKVCHPGGSYNPSAKDHKEGLEKVIKEEVKRREKMKTTVSQLLRDYEERVNAAKSEPSEEKEQEEQKEEESVVEGDEEVIKQARKTEKLTKAQRNKQLRNRSLQRDLQTKKEEKRLKAQLSSVEQINKSLKIEEKSKALKRKRNEELRASTEVEPQRKINGKVVERLPAVDVVLPSQLSDNMRRMKPHGGLIFDRFESMQARNLLETGNLSKRKHKPRGRKKLLERGKDFIEKPKMNTPKKNASEGGDEI